MSKAQRDDEQDQPGGTVVPFPGAHPVPLDEVPGTALEPVPDALEGEIVTEEEYARLTGLQRRTTGRVVHLATAVRNSEHTTGAGRAMLRAGLTVGQGVGSWARRGHPRGVPAPDRRRRGSG